MITITKNYLMKDYKKYLVDFFDMDIDYDVVKQINLDKDFNIPIY